MYKVFCNDKLMYDDRLESLQIYDTNLALELGKTGAFEFTVYPSHVYYDEVVEMVSLVEIHRNDEVIFYGRIFNIEYGFYNEKQVSCEGELAFLLDSLIAPYAYGSSFSGFFRYLIEQHNSQVEVEKQFKVGSVTVGDYSPFTAVENLEYINTLETMNKRLVEASGGYLSVRHENGVRYLDLLSASANVSNVSKQEIRLGKNLIDLKRESNSEDVFSCIVPLGAKEENSEIRLDIKNVNSGLHYIENADAIALYGRIYKQVIFDNITYAQTLLETARTYLAENYAGISSITITAHDLAFFDDTLENFKVGEWVYVYDNMHFSETAQSFLIRKITIDILNPAKTVIEMGKSKKGFIENVLGLYDSMQTSSNSSTTSESEEPEEIQQPYLIESGKTGIWSWARYSDNTCEFFGKVPVYSNTINTALGSWYRGANLYEATAYEYPFEMTEAPALNMQFQTRNGLGALLWIFSQDADTAQRYLPQSYLIRPTTATNVTGNINIIARGKL